MGNKSTEYLPLVANNPLSEESFQHPKSEKTIAPREKLLVLIVLLQAVTFAVLLLTRTREGTQCPHSDRSILYCTSRLLHQCMLIPEPA
jgi:hypothetical protein